MSIGGISQVDDMIGVLRGLQAAGPEFTAAGTNAVLEQLRRDVAAGKDPNTGETWKPTLKGTAPLRKAAQALSARIVGTVGIIALAAPYNWHFWGTGYLPKRRALLQGKLPDRLGDAIARALVPPFEAITKRGKIGTKKFDAWLAGKGGP